MKSRPKLSSEIYNIWADKDGNVYRKDESGHFIKETPHCNSQGYPTFRRWPVHYIVLRAFRGERPEGMVCRHLNDVKTDNRLENLAYGTRAQNYRDCIRNFG